ncbi:hypothethical protein (plasmid) [Ralstonia solanacearum CMR15]|nr:hypothethical protein [Ralstonia solanacearum CMR15]
MGLVDHIVLIAKSEFEASQLPFTSDRSWPQTNTK